MEKHYKIGKQTVFLLFYWHLQKPCNSQFSLQNLLHYWTTAMAFVFHLRFCNIWNQWVI